MPNLYEITIGEYIFECEGNDPQDAMLFMADWGVIPLPGTQVSIRQTYQCPCLACGGDGMREIKSLFNALLGQSDG